MASTHIIVLLALTCVPNALSSVEFTKAKNDEEIFLSQMYSDMDKGIKYLVRENLKSVLRVFVEKSQELNVSTKCMGDSLRIFSGLRDLKLWALSFIDATGKPSDGILSGSFHMMGNYDQCLNSSAPKKGNVVDFRGQYCLISTAPYLPNPEITPDNKDRVALVQRLTQNLTEPMRLFAYKSEALKIKTEKFGVCVPSGCDTNDVDKLIKYAGKLIRMNLTLEYCDTEDTLTYFNLTRIVILCIYSFFIILVFCGSVIEQYSKAKKIKFENAVIRSVICFSIPSNFPKFMSTKVGDRNLSCLNGIRVLTLFYVIFGHHYFTKLELYMTRNTLSAAFTWVPRFFFQIILNGTFTVDVFFFIGGFLNCYIRAKRNFTTFSPSKSFMLLIHRLFRIYPVLIFSILLVFLLNPRGPMSHYMETKYGAPCITMWWKNILFINNFYDSDNQCAPQTWYLAADMQFFLVALFTIPLLFRNPKLGVLVNLTIILSSIIISSVLHSMKNLPPSVLPLQGHSEEDFKTFARLFNLPFLHASSYFGGVLLGFFISKKGNLTFSKTAQFFGWIAASTMICTMLFVTKRWNNGYPYTKLENILYASLSRPLYTYSIGWLIFCCYVGQGGVINYILSLKVWIPLNRLCLTAYLISPILQMFFNGNLRTPMDAQTEIMIWGYFGDMTVTFLLSLPMVLMFESPFIALEKIIFPTKEKPSELNEKEMVSKEIIGKEMIGNEMIGKEIIQINNDKNCEKDKN